MIWDNGKGCDRGMHGFVSGAQNVERINLNVIHYTNGPDHLRVGRQVGVNVVAHLSRELFRVVQFAVWKFLGKNDRCRHHRARECATAHFIDSGDMRHPDGSQFLLVSKAAAAIHQCKSFPICTE